MAAKSEPRKPATGEGQAGRSPPAPLRTAAPAPRAAAVPASTPQPVPTQPNAPTGAQLRSIGPGGFLRQGPGRSGPSGNARAAAPFGRQPRSAAEYADKTGLLDLSEKICKWPLGHPGEPDFHFCGDKVNPGFPYCVAHCGHAYQAQMPRRDRRPAPASPVRWPPRPLGSAGAPPNGRSGLHLSLAFDGICDIASGDGGVIPMIQILAINVASS